MLCGRRGKVNVGALVVVASRVGFVEQMTRFGPNATMRTAT
jgi:hypothetical protein